jgi:hypothetical protein
MPSPHPFDPEDLAGHAFIGRMERLRQGLPWTCTEAAPRTSKKPALS